MNNLCDILDKNTRHNRQQRSARLTRPAKCLARSLVISRAQCIACWDTGIRPCTSRTSSVPGRVNIGRPFIVSDASFAICCFFLFVSSAQETGGISRRNVMQHVACENRIVRTAVGCRQRRIRPTKRCGGESGKMYVARR
jgi:hypothetical protein